ncbi:MAG: O-methyltransferase [Bacteroidetes bacterium]|nr:O-methyltransferase [Bacteroidota bacterium]MCH8170398.1 O-methyltransferase [Bacteroidota bacterium]
MKKIIYPDQLEYISSFEKKDNALIKKIERYAREHKVPILSKDSSNFLEHLIVITRPKKVLEIGTAVAYSSIKIGRNLSSEGILYTIEKSNDKIKIAIKFINKAKLEDKINLLEGDAQEIMPKLKVKFDFIFLDADKEDYKKLFDLSLSLLKKGGVIFIDNLLWHGFAASKKVPKKYASSTKHIRSFNKMFMKTPSLNTSIMPIGDGIGLGIKIK